MYRGYLVGKPVWGATDILLNSKPKTLFSHLLLCIVPNPVWHFILPQWCTIKNSPPSPLHRQLALSRDISGCRDWRCYWHLAGRAPICCQTQKSLPQQNQPTQNVSGAKLEKLCYTAHVQFKQNFRGGIAWQRLLLPPSHLHQHHMLCLNVWLPQPSVDQEEAQIPLHFQN